MATTPKDKKTKRNPKPVRAVFWIGSLIFLLSFLIILPIYHSATMTTNEHLAEGLIALKGKDFSKAKAHLLKASQSQNAQAFFVLGSMEMDGKNATKKADPKEAAIYFEKAAKLGMKDAQYTLALLYDRGEGVQENKQKALDWGLLAAAQGDVNALYATAVWLERGYAGKPEPHQALALYEYAASQGHQNSMISLISIYGGTGDIPANKTRATYWKNKLQEIRAVNKNNKEQSKGK